MISRLVHVWYVLLGRLGVETLGVKVIVSKGSQALLVRHRLYPKQWMLPGGGIKRKETPREAARREMQEELGIVVHSFSDILGVYTNTREGRKDTVAVLIARLYDMPQKEHWSFEIKESRFFNTNDLPPETSPATFRRIAEYQSGKRSINAQW